jgi:hypothetical protein
MALLAVQSDNNASAICVPESTYLAVAGADMPRATTDVPATAV